MRTPKFVEGEIVDKLADRASGPLTGLEITKKIWVKKGDWYEINKARVVSPSDDWYYHLEGQEEDLYYLEKSLVKRDDLNKKFDIADFKKIRYNLPKNTTVS